MGRKVEATLSIGGVIGLLGLNKVGSEIDRAKKDNRKAKKSVYLTSLPFTINRG